MKVLVAEDDQASSRLLQASLQKWGYEVVACRNGAEAWAALQGEDAPRLAILDWMMPELDGIEVCRRIRSRASAPYVYVLLLTAKGQREDIITGLDAGADDYLTKPVYPRELELRLRTGRRILDLQSDLISTREALRIQATVDPLTVVSNRRAILETIEHELFRASRQMLPMGVILIDLDRFKSVNDKYGHAVGDAVLIEAARRMRVTIRPYDTLGRYGGEEFLVVTPGCDLANSARIAERLRAALANAPIQTTAGPLIVTASFGVAASAAESATDSSRLIHAADEALYRAKGKGRDRVVAAENAELTACPAGESGKRADAPA